MPTPPIAYRLIRANSKNENSSTDTSQFELYTVNTTFEGKVLIKTEKLLVTI